MVDVRTPTPATRSGTPVENPFRSRVARELTVVVPVPRAESWPSRRMPAESVVPPE